MMKRSRAELKLMARQALAGNYVLPVVSALCIMIVFFAASMIYYFFMLSGYMVSNNASTAGLFLVLMVVGYLVMLILMILFYGGYARVCYQICVTGKAELNDLFYAFGNGPGRFLGAMLLVFVISFVVTLPGVMLSFFSNRAFSGSMRTALHIIAWLLTYIPGVIISMRYSLAVMILVENPACGVFDSFRQSKYLIQNNGWRFVMLGLSFLGWFFLGYVSFGVGYLWIFPYLVCTMVFFYLSIKEEKYHQSQSSSQMFDEI